MARARAAAGAVGRLAVLGWGVVCLAFFAVLHPWVSLAAVGGLGLLLVVAHRYGQTRRPVVLLSDAGLVRRVGRRPSEQVLWDEVERVLVVCQGGTADVLWLVEGAHGTGVLVPWDSAPAGLLRRLQQLEGFDSRAVITACSVWDRQVLQAWPGLSPP